MLKQDACAALRILKLEEKQKKKEETVRKSLSIGC